MSRWNDDLLWQLQCAISDATDCDGISEDALRVALAAQGIAVVPAGEREQMAEALKRTLSWLSSYPGGGPMGPTGPYEQARAALVSWEPQP